MATSGFSRSAFVISAILLAGSAAQSQTVARWQGGSGDWTDESKWDIGVVPNNAGGETYQVVIDPAGEDPIVSVNSNVTISGLRNTDTLRVATGGTLTCSGNVTNEGSLTAAGGTLRFNSATVANTGHRLVADGGLVELVNTTVNGGTLEVTDDENSRVQFVGDITLNGVPWVDPGAGVFQVNGTTARFLADYSDALPAGYTLQVLAWGQHATLTLPGGEYQNDGILNLTSGYGGWARLHFDQDVELTGAGRIEMHGNETALEGEAAVEATVGPDQTLQGYGKVYLPVLNQGSVEAAGGSLVFSQPLENAGTLRSVAGRTVQLSQGLVNSGTVEILGTTTLTGLVEANGNLEAGPGSTLRFSGATVTNTGHTIRADGGVVELVNSTVNGGSLEATDDANSFVQFSGDVTLNSVPWIDSGAGVFRVNGTSARFLADYAHGLPAGYTLQVLAWGQHATLNLPGGEYQNDGILNLTSGYGGWARLHFDQDVELTGAGRIEMHGNETALEGEAAVEATVGPDQTLQGYGKVYLPVLNQGSVEAAGGSLVFSQPLENAGTLRSVAGSTVQLSQGLVNSGTVEILGTTTLTGLVEANGNLEAGPGSTLRFSGATVTNTGHTIRADGGVVELVNSTVNGGSLEATDDANSFVQFSGDVTLNGVPWIDSGAGVFRVNGTSARFLADYAHGLPAGYTLQVLAWGQHATLNLPGGEYQNDGILNLTSGYGGWARLHFDQDVELTGAGRIEMHGNETALEGEAAVEATVGPDQTLQGYGKVYLPVLNQGSVEAAGGSLVFSQPLENAGTLRSVAGGTLVVNDALLNEGILRTDGGVFDINGPLSIDDLGLLTAADSGSFHFANGVLGDTTNHDQFGGFYARFDGTGIVQAVEAMSRDRGATGDGFDGNFAYASIALVPGAHVRLDDLLTTRWATGREALYVITLNVPPEQPWIWTDSHSTPAFFRWAVKYWAARFSRFQTAVHWPSTYPRPLRSDWPRNRTNGPFSEGPDKQ